MDRSRTSFYLRSDNRSREQERRKQKLVLQLVPTDHARTYNKIPRWILFEEEESKIAHLRNSGYEKQNPRSRCSRVPLDEDSTSESSPLHRVRPVFRRGEARSTSTRHFEDTTRTGRRRLTRHSTTNFNTSASRKNPLRPRRGTAAECWLVLMVVPVLLLHTAYIPHDEHGHARSSLRERNADDDSGSRGLFDACPFGRDTFTGGAFRSCARRHVRIGCRPILQHKNRQQ